MVGASYLGIGLHPAGNILRADTDAQADCRSESRGAGELDAGSGPLGSTARPYDKRESKGPKVPLCGILEVSKGSGDQPLLVRHHLPQLLEEVLDEDVANLTTSLPPIAIASSRWPSAEFPLTIDYPPEPPPAISCALKASRFTSDPLR